MEGLSWQNSKETSNEDLRETQEETSTEFPRKITEGTSGDIPMTPLKELSKDNLGENLDEASVEISW